MRVFSYIIALFMFLACKKKETDIIPVKDQDSLNVSTPENYLVSAEQDSKYSKEDMQVFAELGGYQSLSDLIVSGVTTFKIEYLTTYKNNSVTASGLIHIPTDLSTEAPILSYQHGTTFLKSNAPTLKSSGIALIASAGYIVIEPDYLGYGSSDEIFHPYYDETYSASSVTDFIKASREFILSRSVPFNKKLFLAGFSEGGYVTLAAQKSIENTPIPEIELTAVAAGAGGFDLTDMLDLITTSEEYTYPAYLAFIITSYDTTYNWPENFDYYFSEPYASKFPSLIDGSKGGSKINSELTMSISSLLDSTFFYNLKNGGEETFRQALKENSLTDWTPVTPLRLYHGTEDQIIPITNTERTYNSLKSAGAVSIEMKTIAGATHSTSGKPMILDFLPWFNSLR